MEAASRSFMLPMTGMLVGMHRERRVVQQLRQPAVRLVLDAHPPLFLHDLALALERVFVDAQRRHAIGLEPQHQRQVLRRRGLPVDGDVFARLGVGLAADAGDERAVRLGLARSSTPLNIMCSNRCANPVRPGFSSFEPTWYHSSTCTIGVE